ncbi:MAG TPA: hypothetical protein VKV17_06035 [Bryobacteraceae bacterium]|nr:hypothetical protein [Bryobacteraceae bacterium]
MKLSISLLILTAPALVPAFAQNQQPNTLDPKVRGVIDAATEKRIGVPTGPAPRLKNGKPDMSGVWNQPYVPDMSKDGRGQQGEHNLPFTELGLAKWKAYDAAVEGDYTGSCLPFGLLRDINSPHPMQIVQNDKYIAFLFEQNTWFHVVPTDGRPHPKDPDPTWEGNSVGHWDGDTLVIDTIGFNDKTRMDTIGHPHSDKLHTVERLQRVDAGHIAYEITIDDPLIYSRPWKNTRTFVLRPDWEIMEYSCEENNKDITEGHIKQFKGGDTAGGK